MSLNFQHPKIIKYFGLDEPTILHIIAALFFTFSSMDFYKSPRLKTSETFTEFSYEELEEKNLELKAMRANGKSNEDFQAYVLNVLKTSSGIKAVTVCFTDLEGKLQLLDYNKKFLMDSFDNLTFDGSSIRGFTPQNQSDLRLKLDWSSFRYLPGDIFGSGKVLMFSFIYDQQGKPYGSDYRGLLHQLKTDLMEKQGLLVNVAPEIEGFLVDGENAEQNYDELEGFDLVSEGGYFNVLPLDPLRQFIDFLAEAIRAMGFENEKDHPEVAPSQFEINYKYTDILQAVDQIMLYKITARQIAKMMGMTASFLPKPFAGINGSGMHTNISLNREGKNLFFDGSDQYGLSKDAYHFITGILAHGHDLCLTLNSSVNAYRRLDPHFEAPNEIKFSSTDRGSMIRIPLANERSARIEVRTVAPDANPYLAYYLLLKAGLKGMMAEGETLKTYETLYDMPVKKLPGTIYEAIEMFKNSTFIHDVMGEENRMKYLELKSNAAKRSPEALGTRVKNGEVIYHHEVYNQVIWNNF